MRTTVCLLTLLSLALATTACGGPDDSAETAWTEIRPAEMEDATKERQRRASKARDALFGRLSKRLVDAIEADGPAGAVTVCRDVAPQIAQEVSASHALAIGRTSFRLRNPDNRPPAWAEPYVEARTEDDVYLTHPEGGLRALLAIGLTPRCVTCHGDREAMPEPLRAAIANTYPDDEAVGFEAGDLRGWFWIEVP